VSPSPIPLRRGGGRVRVVRRWHSGLSRSTGDDLRVDGAGRLRRYHAGRELRVRTTELAELMGTPANSNGGNSSEATPEKEAELYLDRRRQAGRKRG
jgi:hypothetical protein